MPTLVPRAKQLDNSGAIVGSAYSQRQDSEDVTGVFPADNTIPQISEGTEVFSLIYTPVRNNSKLRITTQVHASETANNANKMILAMFMDGAADAIAATFEDGPSENPATLNMLAIPLTFEVSHNGVGVGVTISVRFGADAAGTRRINGSSASSTFLGNRVTSFLKIEEILL